MDIIKYPDSAGVDNAISAGEPLLAVIFFDGKIAVVSHADEAVEHHILLMKAGFSDRDVDKCFRIVADGDGADWTFICPQDYKGITDRQRRIAEFYKDGFAAITEFLKEIGLPAEIEIPKRYRRHLEYLKEV